MALYETKTIGGQLLDINEKDGIVQFLGNSFKVDSDRERFEQNAFDASIAEFGPLGTVKAHRIKHLFSHWPPDIIGKFNVLRAEERGLFAESQIIPTEPHGRNALLLYAHDVLEHSVGFTREASNAADNEGVVVITKAMLWEISSLPWGADMNTPALGFKSQHDPGFRDELTRRIKAMKQCVASPLTDETAQALELHLAQLEAFAEVLKAQHVVKNIPGVINLHLGSTSDTTDTSRFTLDTTSPVGSTGVVTAKEVWDHLLYLDGLYGLRWKHQEDRLKRFEDAVAGLKKATDNNPLTNTNTPHDTLARLLG